MFKSLLFIGIGGGIGSILRYLFSSFIQKIIPSSFALGTLGVNILGCFIVGVLSAFLYKQNDINQTLKNFLIIGFCGGFTTFSSFALENINLLHTNQSWYSLIYIFGSIILGLLAVELGFILSKFIY